MINNKFDILYEDSNYSITCEDNDSDTLLLCFSGENGLFGGTDGIILNTEEFVASTNGAARMFIKNKTRHAGQLFKWDEMPSLFLNFAKGRKISALGNSSGAMSAIYLSSKINIDTVISFNPIYSTYPEETVPEYRVSDYHLIKDQWEFKNLNNCFNTDTKHYMFLSSVGIDKIHNERFPDSNNINKFYINSLEYSHYSAKHLKHAGVLHESINKCLNNEDKEYIYQLLINNNIDVVLG